MDFDQLYKQYRQQQTTEKETAYVEDFIRKARKIGARKLNGEPEEAAVVKTQPQPVVEDKPEEKEEPVVKYGWHDFKLGVRHFFTGLLTVIILAAILVAYGWIKGGSYARENLVVNENEAKTAAITQVKDQYTYQSNELTAVVSKKQFVFCWPMTDCFYYYIVSVSSSSNSIVYQVYVSGSYAGVTRLLS